MTSPGLLRGSSSDHRPHRLIAAIYEFVAVRSKRLPTITDLVKSLPLVVRVAVIGVVVLTLIRVAVIRGSCLTE